MHICKWTNSSSNMTALISGNKNDLLSLASTNLWQLATNSVSRVGRFWQTFTQFSLKLLKKQHKTQSKKTFLQSNSFNLLVPNYCETRYGFFMPTIGSVNRCERLMSSWTDIPNLWWETPFIKHKCTRIAQEYIYHMTHIEITRPRFEHRSHMLRYRLWYHVTNAMVIR